MIYEPREDSFLLEKYVKKFAQGKVLDMGTGSGIQAKAALTKTKEVTAADSNQEAVAHVKHIGIKAVQSDLFSNIKGKFDTIIFNPPYLPETEGEDKESQEITTGGKQGYELIERFLKEAKAHLNPKGIILIVYSSLTGNIVKVAKKQGFKVEVLEEQRMFFERIIISKLFFSFFS